jgi:hypothetical protein
MLSQYLSSLLHPLLQYKQHYYLFLLYFLDLMNLIQEYYIHHHYLHLQKLLMNL